MALAASVAALADPSALEAQKSTMKPNIIFILADDLGYGDLSCYGQQHITTPRLDQMAAQGLRLTRHYAGSTVSAPSRCVLMTGLHTGHCLTRGNAGSRLDLRPEDQTVAEWLKTAGYTTALIGKWGLGEPETVGIPNRQGFDYFFGYLNQGHAHNAYPDYLWKNEIRVEFDNPQAQKDGKQLGYALEKTTHSHDLFTEDALQYIEKQIDTTFFLYLAYTLPHVNNERQKHTRLGMEAPDTTMYPLNDWPANEKAKAAMILALDRDCGRIMDKLRELGIAENTLVVFTSDNGPHLEGVDVEVMNSNGRLTGTKRDLTEGGIRVPFIFWWPGTIEAGVSDYVSGFQDFMPTACQLAGLKIPPADGVSLVPLFKGRKAKQKPLYWEFFEGGVYKQAVCDGNWKYIRVKAQETGLISESLYNLADDESEQNNLAASNPQLLARMRELARRLTESPQDPAFPDFSKVFAEN